MDKEKLFNELVNSLVNKKLDVHWFVVTVILIFLYYVIVTIIENYKDKSNLKKSLLLNLRSFLMSSAISVLFILVFGINGVIIGPVFGICLSIYINNKYLSGNKDDKEKDKKDDTKKESADDKQDRGINISIVNNNDDHDHNGEHDIINYFNPDVTLPEGVNINNLDLNMILELYGYISPNQKYKMITSSIFETPDEQINKLLSMYALEAEELKEAKVIFNLIRLKKRLVSKEEALKYIMETEKKSKEGGSDNGES